jgi:hypothetical protein
MERYEDILQLNTFPLFYAFYAYPFPPHLRFLRISLSPSLTLFTIIKDRVDYFLKESTSWSVFSCIIHFYLQECFHFIFFTFLMFRKLNKPQLTKIKQNFIGIRAFDSRLYLDISRFFEYMNFNLL